MRLGLLTSTHRRHKFFARILAERHDLVLTVAEEKGNERQFVGDNNAETAVLQSHFASRDEEEARFFPHCESFPSSINTLLQVQRGKMHDCGILRALQESNIDGVAVFGCGILKPPIFSSCSVPFVNAHQGLSPYYRGSGTNFWPFVRNELQYVGVTLHYIDAGIDTGGIICHGRPRMEHGDTLHRVGCRTVDLSARLVAEFFSLLEAGQTFSGIPQWESTRLYRRCDFNAAAVREAYRHIENGSINRYVAACQRGDAPRVQLITLG